MVEKKYRGRQTQLVLWDLTEKGTLDGGYAGTLGRMAVTARTPVPAYLSGWDFLGECFNNNEENVEAPLFILGGCKCGDEISPGGQPGSDPRHRYL